MPALDQQLIIEQGTTWAHAFPDVPAGRDPIGADWSVRSQVRPAPGALALLHEWSTQLGTAVVAAGKVTLTVAPAASSSWARRAGYYDVEVSSPDGTATYRIASGSITVSPEVTVGLPPIVLPPEPGTGIALDVDGRPYVASTGPGTGLALDTDGRIYVASTGGSTGIGVDTDGRYYLTA